MDFYKMQDYCKAIKNYIEIYDSKKLKSDFDAKRN